VGDHACREPPERVAAATGEANIGEPERPQAARGLGQDSDGLLDDRLGGWCRRYPREQYTPTVRRWLDPIEKGAEAFAVDPAQRENRRFGRAEDELGNCVREQRGPRRSAHHARNGLLTSTKEFQTDVPSLRASDYAMPASPPENRMRSMALSKPTAAYDPVQQQASREAKARS
jgi:hypothetical protein